MESKRQGAARRRLRQLRPRDPAAGSNGHQSAGVRGLADKPGHLVRRCQQIAVALFMDETRGFGLTPVQYAALVAVGQSPGIDQNGLGGLIALDRSSATAVIERLERRRWLRRVASGTDRRRKLLTLTPAGATLLHRMDASVERAQARILAPLPAREWPRFMAMLQRIVDLNNQWSRVPVRQHASQPTGR